MAEGPRPHAARRADGELSRSRILDAATEIAAERGYEGTSIGLVSKKCGLPASSIYWHFKDKDDLIAAVIERSFGRLAVGGQLPARAPRRTGSSASALQTAKALLDSPDFIRLGLMLALGTSPVEPRRGRCSSRSGRRPSTTGRELPRGHARADRRRRTPVGDVCDGRR